MELFTRIVLKEVPSSIQGYPDLGVYVVLDHLGKARLALSEHRPHARNPQAYFWPLALSQLGFGVDNFNLVQARYWTASSLFNRDLVPRMKMLFLGIGGGIMQTHYASTFLGHDILTVERDRMAVLLSKEYWHFNTKCLIQDPFAFIDSAEGTYDRIFLNCFPVLEESGNWSYDPSASVSRLMKLYAMLKPGGCALVNLALAQDANVNDGLDIALSHLPNGRGKHQVNDVEYLIELQKPLEG